MLYVFLLTREIAKWSQGKLLIWYHLHFWVQTTSPGALQYCDVTMGAMASQITSLTIVYSRADQRKHESSASLAFVRGILRWPENSPHKWPATRKRFPFDDVIMSKANLRDLIAATGLVMLLKLDSNHWFFILYHIEIRWMTSKNNRIPFLGYIKLCASFHSHQ